MGPATAGNRVRGEFGEQRRLEFRTEAFNLTNSTHFNDPSGSVTSNSPPATTISSTREPMLMGASTASTWIIGDSASRSAENIRG